MFRRRFWWSLLLTVPIVLTSPMVMDWFGYTIDFPGVELVGPVLGTAIFLWGGWPFLTGGRQELRDRRPGMMLLISMAITVAYVASMASSLDVFELDFWWELAALITIMLLGHWQEMKALGNAQSALAALAALLPDEAERVLPTGDLETIAIGALQSGGSRAHPRRRAGACGRRDRRGRGRDRRIDRHRREPTGGERRRRKGDRGHRQHGLQHPRARDSRGRRHRVGGHPTARGAKRNNRTVEPRRSPIASPRCCSMWPLRRPLSRSRRGPCSAMSTRRSCGRSPCW